MFYFELTWHSATAATFPGLPGGYQDYKGIVWTIKTNGHNLIIHPSPHLASPPSTTMAPSTYQYLNFGTTSFFRFVVNLNNPLHEKLEDFKSRQDKSQYLENIL